MKRHEKNHVSLHVVHRDGSATVVDVGDDRSVAAQLLAAWSRTLGAYQPEIRAELDGAERLAELAERLGLTRFMANLGRVLGPHPSTVDEPPVLPDRERLLQALEDMHRQQVRTDEDGGREVAWYYWHGEVAEALGLDSEHFNHLDEDDEDDVRADAAGPVTSTLVVGVDGDVATATRTTSVPGRPGVYQTVVELPDDDQPAPEEGYDRERHYLPGTDILVDEPGSCESGCTTG